VTAQSHQKTVVRGPETGWSRARRLRGRNSLRTWVPAVAGRDAARGTGAAAEGNIVLGED
jgi:hypothetical protein